MNLVVLTTQIAALTFSWKLSFVACADLLVVFFFLFLLNVSFPILYLT